MSSSPTRPPLVLAPEWPVLRVVGPDAASWLNGIVTCDVVAVTPDRGAFGLLLTKHGKVQAELQIVGQSDALSILVSGGNASEVLDTLSKYLVMEDAELEEAPEFGVVLAIGAVDDRLGASLPWGGEPVRVRVVERSAVAGECERLRADGFEEALVESPSVRLRVGLPLFGRDYSSEDNPHDASLERRAVSWSKGCYLGQEVVCMQDMRGKVKRRIVRLRGDLTGVDVGTPLLGSDSVEVGRVTSVTPDAALGRLKAPHFEAPSVECAGRKLSVEPLAAP